jgi:hypothetical protein
MTTEPDDNESDAEITNKLGELAIPLPNGGTLCCQHDNDLFGESVHIRDADGNEILMWSYTEWEEDPVLVMGAIFGAALRPIDVLLKDLKRTRVEDGCWL